LNFKTPTKQRLTAALVPAAALLLPLFIIAGCAIPENKHPTQICPGARSLSQSVAQITENAVYAENIRANGQCRLEYQLEEKKRTENFPVKLWVEPPRRIYLQGDVAFNPRGIILGSNEDEFWLAIKPKEVSGYWWGKWSRTKGPGNMMINPRLILEALAMVRISTSEIGQNWSLKNKGQFDILTRYDENRRPVKQIYIYCCDYTVARILYFDSQGNIAAETNLYEYKQLTENFVVPGVINIRMVNEDVEQGPVSIRIELSSIKTTEFNDKQRQYLFIRPEPEGYDNIYKILNNRIYKQN